MWISVFVTTAICAASRASIFTGLVERTHGFTFGTPPVPRQYVEISYPFLLRKAGYRTGFIGKFGVNMGPDALRLFFDHFQVLHARELPGQAAGRHGPAQNRLDGRWRRGVPARRFQEGTFCLSLSFNAPHADDPNPQQYVWPPSEDHLYDAVTVPPTKRGDPDFSPPNPNSCARPSTGSGGTGGSTPRRSTRKW